MKPKVYKVVPSQHRDRLSLGMSEQSIKKFYRDRDKKNLHEYLSYKNFETEQNQRLTHLQNRGHEDESVYNLPSKIPPDSNQNYRRWRQANDFNLQILPASKFYSLPQNNWYGYL